LEHEHIAHFSGSSNYKRYALKGSKQKNVMTEL